MLGQYQTAIADFDKAIQLDPDDAFAYISRGVSYAQLGQHATSVADFTTVILRAPYHAKAYNNRGHRLPKLANTHSPTLTSPKPAHWTASTANPCAS